MSGEADTAESSCVPPAPSVTAQVNRILASATFSKSDRLSSFLTFVVQETLRDRGTTLKESVLARELYGRSENFDTASDPAVRIDARRLRDKLREYYSESADDPVLISIPKGRYAAVFEWNQKPPLPAAEQKPSPAHYIALHFRRILIASAALVLLAGAVGYVHHDRATQTFAPVPLTTFQGYEGPPSLSPDGQFVAFSWTGSRDPVNQDIYVKEVGGEALHQLTNTLWSEHDPAWSPDGRHIAFVREGQGVFVMSPLGGEEKRVSETGTLVRWAADSKSLLIRDRAQSGAGDRPFGIYRVFPETQERRQITQAPAGIGDSKFSISPDGKLLAFVRYTRRGIADLFVVPMSGGSPRQITNWASWLGGVAWTPDGREIVYSVRQPYGTRLWRVPLNSTSPRKGALVSAQTGNADDPSISRPGPNQPTRLAYRSELLDVGFRLLDLETQSGGSFTSPKHFADSTRMETGARFSPNGATVAFTSDRGGSAEIWVCDRNGAEVRQITSLGASQILPGGWSPDGQMIVFDASINGNTDVYVVPESGGPPKRLTYQPSLDSTPSWSRDGKWIYFSSTRFNLSVDEPQTDIWRVPAAGGDPTQMTKHGGFEPQESPDGRSVYYLDRPPVRSSGMNGPGTLKRMPATGGEEALVLKGIPAFLWSVTARGIYFATKNFVTRTDSLEFYRFDTGTVIQAGSLGFRVSPFSSSMTVSWDGRWLLTNQVDRFDSDLMVVNDFK